MPFWKCFYHVVWATKHRTPSIEPAYESVIFADIRRKAERFGSQMFAVNGVEDHIHVAVTIPPNVAVAKWIGEVKGSSAHAVNTAFNPDTRFHWQAGYGVLTFGKNQLSFVIDYVQQQKEHHNYNHEKIYKYLETMSD